jgi:asparagine synthase (glutamine-hydrolysing)
MCGIAGRINFNKTHVVDVEELKSMTDAIVHRGPDDEGHYNNENVGLGFRRLSIIDLHTGHQPLSNQEENVWITFNGEIYNYRELRADLIAKGYPFKTATDTEVILALYLEHGENCVSFLRGMFAFVIWDDRKKQLFGARDRFGIKPFHYYLDDRSFVWGSEIKAINAARDIKRTISLEALDGYFTYGYILNEQSIFTQIKKLLPAHYFILKPFDDHKLTIKKYWSIVFDPDYSKSEEYWVESIKEVLLESVKLELVSDVPLGAFLSGGIDSSSVVALMSKASDRPVKTFSIGFKEKDFNELEYARMVAEKYNTEHHELMVEPESISLLPKLVQAYDEPFADSSAIPTYYVSKFAREYVTVALSGDGGDELFAGYDSYHKIKQLANNWLSNTRYSRRAFNFIHKIIPDHVYGKGYTYYASKDVETVGAYFCLWKAYERKLLFNNDLLTQFKNSPSEVLMVNMLNKNSSPDLLSKNLKLDMETYMVDDILTKVDRASMLNSLEVRVPVLDHKLAELSFRIPPSLKLKGNSKKYILKKAMADFLPDEVLNHKKQGFSMPFKLWFKDDLKEYLSDSLTANSRLSQYINIDYINHTLQNHQKGMRDFSGKIWSLIFFNEWLNTNKL